MTVWRVVRKASADAVHEYFSPLRRAWFFIAVGAGLIAWDIILRLSK